MQRSSSLKNRAPVRFQFCITILLLNKTFCSQFPCHSYEYLVNLSISVVVRRAYALHKCINGPKLSPTTLSRPDLNREKCLVLKIKESLCISESTSVFSGSLHCLIYPNHFLVHNALRTDVFFS